MPLNEYQQQLITMGSEIIRLWFWEPPPELIAKSKKKSTSSKRQSKKRRIDKRPGAIRHNSSTFALTKPHTTYGTATAHSSSASDQDARTLAGQTLLTPVSLDRRGQLSTSVDEASTVDEESVACNSIMLRSSPVTGTLEDKTDDNSRKSDICSPQIDIMSWYENVVDCKPVPFLPLTPTPFEKGTIGGPSVNDFLMIKGLIHPALYVQFLDLRPFSLP